MRLSLRLKLSIASLLLIIIPLSGLRFSDMIQQELLKSRTETMLFSARAMAAALMAKDGLFAREQFLTLNPQKDIYLYPLSRAVRINGKDNDWSGHDKQWYGQANTVYSDGSFEGNFGFNQRLGIWGNYLYAFIEVHDKNIVYRQNNSLRLNQSDYLQITTVDADYITRKYIITTDAPGWVNGFLLLENDHTPELISQIQGTWLETEKGYNLEIRMPMSLLGKQLDFSVADVDDKVKPVVKRIISTAGPGAEPGSPEQLNQAIAPSKEIAQILRRLDRPNSRVSIIDRNHKVRASFGHLLDDEVDQPDSTLGIISQYLHQLLKPLYQLFLKPFSAANLAPRPTSMDYEGVDKAFTGKASVSLYRSESINADVMAAAAPLLEKNTIVGAVVVEQTTNSILSLQNRVIEESLTLTVVVFFSISLGLFLFAFSLSSRIRLLRNQAASAIDGAGNLRASIRPFRSRDEIGDLSRTLVMMLRQIRQQNEYREKMADNLEHEMRTPLAGASASLQNLSRELNTKDERTTNYLNWAISDINRLETLLTTIREASNLQEALKQDCKEDFDLAKALELWLEHSWRPSFAEVSFVYNCSSEAIIHGDPNSIHQMCDKIIENAVSFHDEDSDIVINLENINEAEFLLSIANEGPSLEPEQCQQVFNSMVSIRPNKDETPHLGLGLFIARTIIEHHAGRVELEPLTDGRTGVNFKFYFPISKKKNG
ncbi:MAG: ATP-binding protein [Desulfotalea sp.]